MSERKVLSKYYPPDFDPSNYIRKRKDVPSKLPTVRLMAPFSMKCTHCGEYIYKGRKFNARKQITDEKYYAVPIIRFYIRCTRCSAEITFTTDPKNNDYAAEKGIQRNFEPWREAKLAEETEEERLDRLEREEAERDPMKELEEKVMDAKTEMAIADKLDEIRTRNARIDRLDQDGAIGADAAEPERDLEKDRQDAEDLEAARRAFQSGTGESIRRLHEDDDGDNIPTSSTQTAAASSAKDGHDVDEDASSRSAMPPPTFVKAKKRKPDFGAALGLKKKKSLAA